MIIPAIRDDKGKLREPSCLDAFLGPLLEDLQVCGPKPTRLPSHYRGLPREQLGQGCAVVPYKLVGNKPTPATDRHVNIHIVIVGVHADSPARIKIMNALGLTGYLHCTFCDRNGVYMHGSVRMPGYSNSVLSLYDSKKGHPFRSRMGRKSVPGNAPDGASDAEEDGVISHRLLSAVDLISRENYVQGMHEGEGGGGGGGGGEGAAAGGNEVGTHGVCLLTRYLWYTDPTTIFLVPFDHAYNRGVLLV